jgi:hypothetical protein
LGDEPQRLPTYGVVRPADRLVDQELLSGGGEDVDDIEPPGDDSGGGTGVQVTGSFEDIRPPLGLSAHQAAGAPPAQRRVDDPAGSIL